MARVAQIHDPATLRVAAQLLERENQLLLDKVIDLERRLRAAQGKTPAEMQLRLAQLEQQLARRNQALFGRSSEQRPTPEAPAPAAEAGAEAGAEAEAGAGPAAAKRRKDGKPARPGHGPRAQPALRLIEHEHLLDAADQACPQCGEHLARWAGQDETADEIDVITREFVLRRHRRAKYRCDCGHLETALGPDTRAPGRRDSLAFAIEVAVAKYLDHQPLARQVRAMARAGLVIDTTTLFDQLWALTRVLVPAYEAVRVEILAQPVVMADETRWPLRGADGGVHAPASRWFMWAIASPAAVDYKIYDTRGNRAGDDVLAGFEGTLVTDDYEVYLSLARRVPGLRRASCWAHQRREFVARATFFPVECAAILDLIGPLYGLERGPPAGRAGDAARAAIRATESRAILDAIRRWCLTTQVLPGSGLATALAGLVRSWTALTRFVDDPRIPLDSNGVERALRGPVVGRKNHYGSRAPRGLAVAAILYTRLETAKLVGLDPAVYLRHAVLAGRRGDRVPTPGELQQQLATGRAGDVVAVGEAPAQ